MKMESETGILMDELGTCWKTANDATAWPFIRKSALQDARNIFRFLGEPYQAEMMCKFRITQAKIDQLEAALQNKTHLLCKRIAGTIVAIAIVGFLAYRFR